MTIRFVITVLLLNYLNQNSYGQQFSLEQKIKIIRENFNSINKKIYTFDKKTFDVMQSSQGGQITVIQKNDTLIKVSEIQYGERGKVEIDSYYLNGELSFVFSQTFRYNASIYNQEEREEDGLVYPAFDQNKTKKFEDRFYFFGNELIRWINPNKEFVDEKSEKFIQKQSELIELNSELIKTIKNKNAP